MLRLIIQAALLLFFSAAVGQTGEMLLSKAYKSKSIDQLQSFFENWASETPPILQSDFDKLSDTAQAIYKVFQSFYNPKDINRTGGSEWGNDIYKGTKYFIVQDRIYFAFVDTLISDNEEERFLTAKNYDTLKDFRPQISFPKTNCVVLTKYYDQLLNRFLGDKHYDFGTGNIMSPGRSKGKSEKRMQFLENYIKVWYGHWGGYWQLYSYPYASKITFDKTFQNAVVDYVMIYEGGYAFFKKVKDEWILIKAKRTWIE